MCRNLTKLLIMEWKAWADYLNIAYTNDTTNENSERRKRRTRQRTKTRQRTEQRTTYAEATRTTTTNEATDEDKNNERSNERHNENEATNTATNRTPNKRQYKCDNLIIIPQAIASAIGIIVRLYSYKCQGWKRMDKNAWAVTTKYRKIYISVYNIPHLSYDKMQTQTTIWMLRFTGHKYTHVINKAVILKDTGVTLWELLLYY